MGDDHDHEVERARAEVAQDARKREQKLKEQLRQARMGRDEARKPDKYPIQQIRELSQKLEEKNKQSEQRQQEADELRKLLVVSESTNAELAASLAQEKLERESARLAVAPRDGEITRLEAEAASMKEQAKVAEAAKRRELELEQQAHQKNEAGEHPDKHTVDEDLWCFLRSIGDLLDHVHRSIVAGEAQTSL